MARSNVVWLLMWNEATNAPGTPEAAFTVKHEMMTWLDRNRTVWDWLRLYRMIDGPHPVAAYREEPTVTELDIREVMK